MTARSSGRSARGAVLYASLHVPDFPAAVLQAGKRCPPPTAVACGEPPNRFVYAADASARKCGVREGMALAAAQARYSSAGTGQPLQVLRREAEAERRVQSRLLKLAESATPVFEDVAPGLLSLDFAGLRDPYVSATELVEGAALLGLKANVGVARNRLVALCAARTHPGVTHVYPGEEAGFLHRLPLDTLPLDSRDLQTLERWGVRKIGEMAVLPPARMAERFGERGARMVRLARGEEDSMLRAYRPEARLDLSQDFDWGIEEIESLAFAISDMLERLCLRLQSLDQAAASLTTHLRLASGGTFQRTINLPYPLSDSRTLLTLVRIDLTAHPPGDAVESVRMSAEPAQRRRVQSCLFAPDLPDAESLAVTLARLACLVGDERVGAPTVPDTHRLGAAVLQAFRPSEGGRNAGAKPNQATAPGRPAANGRGKLPSERRQLRSRIAAPPPRGSLVFRCFRPSSPAAVTLRGERPVRVEAREARGFVTACAGPWRVSGEWWTPDGWQYQEWDVEVEGRLYRACCERTTGEWFLAGEYD